MFLNSKYSSRDKHSKQGNWQNVMVIASNHDLQVHRILVSILILLFCMVLQWWPDK